jgi:caffeoyl-CoA O-methyltransferase
MSNETVAITPALNDYIRRVSLREHPVLREVREKTASHPASGMQISPEQGQLMALLARLMGARRCIEIGVFTGYSSLAVALAPPDDGRILACDINEEWTRMARRFWEKAGVAHKIDLRLAPATDTLREVHAAGQAGTYDFAFVDADKESYGVYYEAALELLRPGGLIAVDNTLWDGAVIDESAQDADTVAIREFNESLARDQRVDLSLVPIGDGLTLARKR